MKEILLLIILKHFIGDQVKWVVLKMIPIEIKVPASRAN